MDLKVDFQKLTSFLENISCNSASLLFIVFIYFYRPSEEVTKITKDPAQSGIEISNPPVSNSDDMVELLVVHPDDVVTLDDDTSSQNDGSRSPLDTDSSAGAVYIKEEAEFSLTPEEQEIYDEATIKEESDSVFLDECDVDGSIIELPITEANWTFDGSGETLKVDLDMLHECCVCGNTFNTESLYRSHACVLDNEPSKRKDFFCNACSLTFKSRLVYHMHIMQHKDVNLCHICNVTFSDASSLTSHNREYHSQAAIDLMNMEEEAALQPQIQCDICGKITNNLKQHKIYHTIKELEFCKEENKRSLKKWFLCQVIACLEFSSRSSRELSLQ